MKVYCYVDTVMNYNTGEEVPRIGIVTGTGMSVCIDVGIDDRFSTNHLSHRTEVSYLTMEDYEKLVTDRIRKFFDKVIENNPEDKRFNVCTYRIDLINTDIYTIMVNAMVDSINRIRGYYTFNDYAVLVSDYYDITVVEAKEKRISDIAKDLKYEISTGTGPVHEASVLKNLHNRMIASKIKENAQCTPIEIEKEEKSMKYVVIPKDNIDIVADCSSCQNSDICKYTGEDLGDLIKCVESAANPNVFEKGTDIKVMKPLKVTVSCIRYKNKNGTITR